MHRFILPTRSHAALRTHFVWIIHTVTSAELIKRMLRSGWVLRGVKGSHHVYVHPQRSGHVTVPHPRKDLGTGLLHKLFKQTGLTDQN